MAKKIRKTLLLVGLQTVVGTAATIVAADAVLARSVTLTPLQVEYASRDLIRTYFGNSAQIPISESASVDFEVELAGAGTAGLAPAWGKLLRGCAFAETLETGVSATYTPVSDLLELVTLHVYIDGLFHKITDALGTVSLELTAKGIPVLKFKFMGAYNPIVDAANLTGINYSAFLQPLGVNKRNTPAWSFYGYSGCLQSVAIDMANTLIWRELIKCQGAEITDRKPTGSIAMELPTIAQFDWPTKVRDALPGPLTVTHGTVAGNIVQVNAPAAQLTSPTYTDQDGVAMLSASLTVIPVLGNDEVEIVVK